MSEKFTPEFIAGQRDIYDRNMRHDKYDLEASSNYPDALTEIERLQADIDITRAGWEHSRKGWQNEIAQLRASLFAEQKAHDAIAKMCFAAGMEAGDGTSVSAVKEALTELEDVRKALATFRARAEAAEADADRLAKILATVRIWVLAHCRKVEIARNDVQAIDAALADHAARKGGKGWAKN